MTLQVLEMKFVISGWDNLYEYDIPSLCLRSCRTVVSFGAYEFEQESNDQEW